MLFKRAISVLMLVLILFADSGQTIYAHTCLKSKHTHLSIGRPKHCCSAKVVANNCTVKKATCCEVSSKYLKQHFVSQPDVTDISLVHVIAVLSQSQVFVPRVAQPVIIQAANTSPPLIALSKSAGTFTQTFRI